MIFLPESSMTLQHDPGIVTIWPTFAITVSPSTALIETSSPPWRRVSTEDQLGRTNQHHRNHDQGARHHEALVALSDSHTHALLCPDRRHTANTA
jgi:hypothetical protein